MTFKEFQNQYTENEVTFEHFGGFECDYQKYVKAQEDLFSQALADERRKFAHFLKKTVLPKRVIDKKLTEYEDEQKND